MSKAAKSSITFCKVCAAPISKRQKHQSYCACSAEFHQKCINHLNKTSQLKPFYNDCLCISCAAATLPFLSLINKDFSDLFHDPKSPLPSADDLNRLLSIVPNHFDYDLDDVDNMFLKNNQLDSYLTVQEAHTLLSGKNEECSFSTMCVNVRSLTYSPNFTKFESLISRLDCQSHIIAVNKTWEKPQVIGQHVKLNGYVCIFNPRAVSRDGGVGHQTELNFYPLCL